MGKLNSKNLLSKYFLFFLESAIIIHFQYFSDLFPINCPKNLILNSFPFLIMIRPKRIKYRKPHRGRLSGRSLRGNLVAFGEYGLQAAQPRWIGYRQLEARRRVLTRYVRRGGLWIRVFPDKPVTIRPAETRIGSGKGSLEYWVAVVRPGQILFELRGVSETSARRAIRIATSKLPIKTRFIIKTLTPK